LSDDQQNTRPQSGNVGERINLAAMDEFAGVIMRPGHLLAALTGRVALSAMFKFALCYFFLLRPAD